MSQRREAIALAALIAFGFALRVIFVLALEDHPAHQTPILDSAFHVEWARATAEGREYAPIAGRPFFRAPLYPWFLAAIFRLFGDGLLLPRLIQCGLGAASIALVYLIGRRCFEPRAALLAAAIAATYWLLIYFDGELLSETLVVPLVLLALWLTLGIGNGADRALAFAAGFVWGVTALARPNVLLFLPLVPLWLLWMGTRDPRRSRTGILRGVRLAPALSFGVGVLVPILPVTAYNTFVQGDFTLIASYGGVNLWLGNNPESNGIDAWMPGSRSGWWEGYYDAISLAETAVGRPLRASEVSRYYSRLAWNFLWNQPDQSLPLLGHKLALFWAGEYGNNEPERFIARHFSWVPRLSIGYSLLAPLGLLGMGLVLGSRRRRALFPLWGFFATYMVSVVLFLVTSRYRVPVLPVAMVFAGHALVWLWDRSRARAWRPVAAALAFVAAFSGWALAQGPEWTEVQANGYLVLGSTEAVRGNHDEAAAHLRRVLELAPNRVDALVMLAWSERQLGEHAAAIDHYRRAVDLAPRNSQALEGLFDLALAQDRSAEVEQWIEAYLKKFPRRGLGAPSEVAYYHRGRIRARRGEREAARRDFAAALRSDPRSSRAAIALGDLAREAGRWSEAQRAYERALLALGPRIPGLDHDLAYAGLVASLEHRGRRAEACQQVAVWAQQRPLSGDARAARERCP